MNIDNELLAQDSIRSTHAPVATMDLCVGEISHVFHIELGQEASVRKELPNYLAVLEEPWDLSRSRKGHRGGPVAFKSMAFSAKTRGIASGGAEDVRSYELGEG